MATKKTTTEDQLKEIIELLTPLANLAKFNISEINRNQAVQEERMKMEKEWSEKHSSKIEE